MDRLIDRLDRLHTAPAVACQVLRLLQDEEFDSSELVRYLETDPALTSSILRIVNSSYYGLTRNISSLPEAVAYLGMRSLRLAVLNFGLLQELAQDTPAKVYQDFWRRSLTMAAVASRLAVKKSTLSRDEAFSVGLLADVGVLVFAQLDTKTYVRAYEQMGHTSLLVETERERYGFHHGQLGARLLARWNLPESLTDAVANHHEQNDLTRLLPLTIQVASQMSDVLWVSDSPNVDQVRRLLASQFELDLDGFISLAMECKEIIHENAEAFGVELEGSVDCAALLAQARSQYVEEAMEVAIDWDSLEAVANSES
jgi:HD-like signal output (HDOD) protein